MQFREVTSVEERILNFNNEIYHDFSFNYFESSFKVPLIYVINGTSTNYLTQTNIKNQIIKTLTIQQSLRKRKTVDNK